MRFQTLDGTDLHVEELGVGTPLLMLSGGPGCVNYLRPVAELMTGHLCLLPDPRGVGQSGGEAQDIAGEIDDLEGIREAMGLESWTVLGHSWGADLGLIYALERPERVARLVCFAATGVQYDRDWKAAYEEGKHLEADFVVEYSPEVHTRLRTDYRRYIKQTDVLARLAWSPVPVTFLHMQNDIRPNWFVRQLAELLPHGEYVELSGATHNAWLTHTRELGEVLNGLLREN